MTRRGREWTEIIAMEHMKRCGINKSHSSGEAIRKQYRPFGEAAAVMEKRATEIIALQKQMLATQEQMISNQQEALDFSTALFERLAAAQESGATAPRIGPFIPEEWKISRMTDNMVKRGMNGFDRHVPQSDGSIPREPPYEH